MANGKVPELAANLLVGNVQACHPDDGLPSSLDNAVGRLFAGGGQDDVTVPFNRNGAKDAYMRPPHNELRRKLRISASF